MARSLVVVIGGPYRVPGEVLPDREPQPSPLATALATLAVAIPDVQDELAPLIGKARIGKETHSAEASGETLRFWLVVTGASVAMPIALLWLATL